MGRSTPWQSPPALLLAGALLCLAGAAAPTAHADATDDAFLAALRSKGITYGSPESAIVAAHEVCDELDLGRQKVDIANNVMRNSNLDAYHAGYFVGVSIRAYCPNYAS